MIIASGDLLLAVVDDVLDFSKLESGKVEIEILRSNLQETLDALVHSIDVKGHSKNLTLCTFYDVMLPSTFTLIVVVCNKICTIFSAMHSNSARKEGLHRTGSIDMPDQGVNPRPYCVIT